VNARKNAERIRTCLKHIIAESARLERINPIPSRPINVYNLYEAAENRVAWKVILRHEYPGAINATITFADGIIWDLRTGEQR